MDPQSVVGLFDAENVLSFILFLSFIGAGFFFIKNWGDIRDLIRYRIDSRQEVELAKIEVELEQSKKLSDLTDAMAQHTLQSSRMEAKISVLIESLDRLYRELLNGKSEKGSAASRG